MSQNDVGSGNGTPSPSVLKSPPSPWKGALGGHLNITLRNYAQRRRRRCPGFAPHNLRYVQVPAAACDARSPCTDC